MDQFFVTRSFADSDVQENKVMASVGYLLFFLPLLACPKSKVGRFTANQGLLVWILWILVYLLDKLLGWLPLVGGLIGVVCWAANVVITLCSLYLVVQGLRGKFCELPFVGRTQLLR